MEYRNKIITNLNSKRIEIDGESAFMPLAQFLRNSQGLMGTKIVCAEGDCGACSVLVAREVDQDGKLVFKTVNSCIIPLYLVDGACVLTVESLKINDHELHPVQVSMVENHGAQCGYCTPGFVCAMTGMVEKLKSENKLITEKRAKNFLTGNLCRCTGYRPIIEAAQKIDLDKVELLKDRFHRPDWIAEMNSIKSTPLMLTIDHKSIFLPTSLEQALKAKKNSPEIKLIAGATDLGVLVNKGKIETTQAMALNHISELKKITHDEDFIYVGATVTLDEFEDYIERLIPELKRLLHIFASPQIKNQATIVGNVVNASPIADTIPFLMASDSMLILKSETNEREIRIRDFYLGYKKLDLALDEIVSMLKIRRPKTNEITRIYKVSLRKDLDISAISFAGILNVEDGKIKEIKLAMGGVASTVVRLIKLEDQMRDERFNREVFVKAACAIDSCISPISDLRASKEYRLKLARNLIEKFYDEVSDTELKRTTS